MDYRYRWMEVLGRLGRLGRLTALAARRSLLLRMAAPLAK